MTEIFLRHTKNSPNLLVLKMITESISVTFVLTEVLHFKVSLGIHFKSQKDKQP